MTKQVRRMIAELAGEPFDLLVVGGGITGTGIAREASLRGLKVALVEAEDFACGTSSRSTKLIHGGLRYLKQMDVKLVAESVKERMRLLEMAPHLVKATPFLFPVYQGDPDPLWMLRCGLTLYDLFAGKSNPIPHKALRPDVAKAEEPTIKVGGLTGAAQYCDCTTDDGRLTLEVLLSAVDYGTVAANYAEVETFLYDSSGQAVGASVRDRLSGDLIEVRAKQILLACGPWADIVRRKDDPGAAPTLRLTKGVHITVPAERLPIKHAVVMRGPDGRMMFAVPAGAFSYLGTTDTDHDGDPSELSIDWSDVKYILDSAARTFPEANLTADDVVSAWAGLRNLVRPAGNKSTSGTSRDYALDTSKSGIISVAGGKLTAFRAMAMHIVDKLFPVSKSGQHMGKSTAPFPGAAGARPEPSQVKWLAEQTATALPVLERLAERYNANFGAVAAELPEGGTGEEAWLTAQLRYAIKHEMAVTLEDVLYRRTETVLFTQGNGSAHVEAMAAEMGRLLGWAPERVRAEAEQCHRVIANMFAWKGEARRLSVG